MLRKPCGYLKTLPGSEGGKELSARLVPHRVVKVFSILLSLVTEAASVRGRLADDVELLNDIMLSTYAFVTSFDQKKKDKPSEPIFFEVVRDGFSIVLKSGMQKPKPYTAFLEQERLEKKMDWFRHGVWAYVNNAAKEELRPAIDELQLFNLQFWSTFFPKANVVLEKGAAGCRRSRH